MILSKVFLIPAAALALVVPIAHAEAPQQRDPYPYECAIAALLPADQTVCN